MIAPQISGLGVFNGTKMAGKLDAKETLALLTGQLSSGGMSFGDNLNHDKKYSYPLISKAVDENSLTVLLQVIWVFYRIVS